jgi:uncharacterized protein YjbI with pentapeptide repeats
MLKETTFTKANLTSANFRGAKLPYALLLHANVQDTDFSDADLFWADRHGTRIETAIWTNASLKHVRDTDWERYAAEKWKAGEEPRWTL